jgi:CMP-2-keto-3-deoxyoctulosonic acid synthetase
MVPTAAETLSVDTPEDLERVINLMAGDRLMPQYLGKPA